MWLVWQTLSFCYQELSLGFPNCDRDKVANILCFSSTMIIPIFTCMVVGSTWTGEQGGALWVWIPWECWHQAWVRTILPAPCALGLHGVLSKFLSSLRLGLCKYKILIKSIQMGWQVGSEGKGRWHEFNLSNTWWKEKPYSQELSFDLHKHAVVHHPQLKT